MSERIVFRTDNAGRFSAAREIFEFERGIVPDVLASPKTDPVVREWLAQETRRRRWS